MNQEDNENSQQQQKEEESESPKAETESTISQVEKSNTKAQTQEEQEGIDDTGMKSSIESTMKKSLPKGKESSSSDFAAGGILPFWPMLFQG